jgi:hypothetical protein
MARCGCGGICSLGVLHATNQLQRRAQIGAQTRIVR